MAVGLTFESTSFAANGCRSSIQFHWPCDTDARFTDVNILLTSILHDSHWSPVCYNDSDWSLLFKYEEDAGTY